MSGGSGQNRQGCPERFTRFFKRLRPYIFDQNQKILQELKITGFIPYKTLGNSEKPTLRRVRY